MKAGSTIANVKGMKYFRSNIERPCAYHSNHHSSSGSGSGSSTMTASERKHRRTELRQTNADACFNLATLYEAGYGVERDLQAAYGYYKYVSKNSQPCEIPYEYELTSVLDTASKREEVLYTHYPDQRVLLNKHGIRLFVIQKLQKQQKQTSGL